MNNRYFNWLWLLALVPIVMLSGCGGGGGGGGGSAPKATISGTVTFPSLNNLVGKRVAADVVNTGLTVKVYGLDGVLKATATVTGATYTVSGLDSTVDYVIKAVADNKEMKALVDKGSLTTTTTRDIDTIAATALFLAEKKLSVTPGTIGEAKSSAVTTAAIADLQPTALENRVKTAVNTVLYAPESATQTFIELINLANVVTATVNSGVNTAQFLTGTVTTLVTTNQYALVSGSAAATETTVASVDASVKLTTTANNYTPPPANSVSVTLSVYDYSTISTGTPLSGVTVTTVGLTPEITTTTDAKGLFVLAGVPQNTQFYVKMSKAGFASAYSSTFTLTENLVASDRPYALYAPSKLIEWGNTTGNGVIRSRVVVNTDQVSGYIGDAVVTAIDSVSGTFYPVKYYDSTTSSFSNSLTGTDPLNGIYLVVNVPAGSTVYVTASKSGYTFNTKTFTVQAGGVSESRIVGTAAKFTSAMISGKTFSFQSSDGFGGIATFNSNGTATVSAIGETVTSSWQINSSGQLIITHIDRSYDILTPITSSSTFIAATDEYFDPSYPADNSTGTMTFQLVEKFTTAMISGKTFSFQESVGSGTIVFNSNGTVNGVAPDGTFTGTWLINSAGQLKITDPDKSYNIFTAISISLPTIVTIHEYFDPAYPEDYVTEAMTLTQF